LFVQHFVYSQIELDSTSLQVNTIAENLNVPWEILWGPDDHIWFTEREGQVSRVNPETKEIFPLLTIDEVVSVSESGLLGMALHPNFTHSDSSFVYLVYTYEKGDVMTEKIVRYTYTNENLEDPVILLDDIPANNNHNGSRIQITTDRKILVTTGDAQNTSLSQNENSLAGKILRLNLNGSVPDDNPVSDSYIWTIGHRNPQGFVIASNGLIYSSEHGPSNDDEINIISANSNYGWPNVHGFCNTNAENNFCNANDVTEPIIAWTPTLAVAGIDYYNNAAIPEWQNAILLTTLKEDDFRVLRLDEAGMTVIDEEIYFDNEFGRLRDICVSPDGDIYISTSNRDGRGNGGFPIATDDRIIQLKNDQKMITGLHNSSDNISIYPNPASQELFIKGKEIKSIKVLDLTSKVKSEVFESNTVNISDLKNGLYIIEITSNDNQQTLRKFIKQ